MYSSKHQKRTFFTQLTSLPWQAMYFMYIHVLYNKQYAETLFLVIFSILGVIQLKTLFI